MEIMDHCSQSWLDNIRTENEPIIQPLLTDGSDTDILRKTAELLVGLS